MQHISSIREVPSTARLAAAVADRSDHFELRYRPLSDVGRGFAFPCDARGQVNMDELSDRSRANYLFARAAVGYELQWPLVRRLA